MVEYHDKIMSVRSDLVAAREVELAGGRVRFNLARLSAADMVEAMKGALGEDVLMRVICELAERCAALRRERVAHAKANGCVQCCFSAGGECRFGLEPGIECRERAWQAERREREKRT